MINQILGKQEAGNKQEKKERRVYTVDEILNADNATLNQLYEDYAIQLYPATLKARGKAYFTEHWKTINAALETLLPRELRDVLGVDYAQVLNGIYIPTATVDEIKQILLTVSPDEVFQLDKYGLFVILFPIYSRIIGMDYEYRIRFKTPAKFEDWAKVDAAHLQRCKERYNLEEDKGERRKTFIKNIRTHTDAHAFTYLCEVAEIVTPVDFVGLEIKDSIKFLDDIQELTRTGNYIAFYVIAKECLQATPQELEQIIPPPALGSFVNAQIIAEQYLEELYIRLDKLEETINIISAITDREKREQAIINVNAARTPEEHKQAIDAARKMADEEQKRLRIQTEPTLFTTEEYTEDTATVDEPDKQEGGQVDNLTANTETAEIIRCPENFGLILSRDIYASKNGRDAKDILPISAFISDYVTRKGLDKYISPYVVSKAVEGVNLLQRIKRVRPVNGLYTYEFNISQFSELVGYEDANEERKKELLTALMVLSDLYLIVWKQNGRHAIKVMSVRSIGLDGQAKGNIVLDVTAAAMAGRPNLITWNELHTIRKNSKGQAELHFRYQIYSKEHIAEDDMLTQVFGYDTILLEARGNNPYEENEQLREAKEYIRKHKSADKKKLRTMFDKYVKFGIITQYEYKANKKGDYIYKWKRLKNLEEAPILPETNEIQGGTHLDVQIPDEQ